MSSRSQQPVWVTILATVVALASGAGMAVQARINGELSVRIDNGVLAALISFAVGLVIVLVAVACAPTSRRGLRTLVARGRDGSIPWAYFFGGAAGAFIVLSQGLVAAVLGVALFSVGVVAGQTLSALAIDRRGVGTMSPKPITALRVAGTLLALAAVVFAGSSQLHADFPVWMIVLPFLGGIGIAWQQAVNGQVREVSRSAIAATLVNFVVGTTVLLVGAVVYSLWAGWPAALPMDPILYLGGVIGVVFIAVSAIIVRYLGVLLLGLGMIAGQLLGSLVLDILIPAEGHELSVPTVVATLVTLGAVSLTALGGRPRATRER